MSKELIEQLVADAEYIRYMPDFVGSSEWSSGLMIRAAQRIQELEQALNAALGIIGHPDDSMTIYLKSVAEKEI